MRSAEEGLAEEFASEQTETRIKCKTSIKIEIKTTIGCHTALTVLPEKLMGTFAAKLGLEP